jgi:hypothetical protein
MKKRFDITKFSKQLRTVISTDDRSTEIKISSPDKEGGFCLIEDNDVIYIPRCLAVELAKLIERRGKRQLRWFGQEV